MAVTMEAAFSMCRVFYGGRGVVGFFLALWLVSAFGCQGPRGGRRPLSPPLAPIPLGQAAAIVNENISRVSAALRATGNVDGHFRTEGGRLRRYDVNGVLFYLPPAFVRLDLKKLGDRQFLFGSNEAMYWVYSREDEEYHCGRHGEFADDSEDVPFRPEHIPAALGLDRISTGDALSGSGGGQVQRIDDEYQQILFVGHDASGQTLIEKEYWLDRRAPRLVRRVIFRDAAGAVELISELDDYRRLPGDGPYLPHEMTAQWPKTQARMRFQVDRWELAPQVTPAGPQFESPAQCLDGG